MTARRTRAVVEVLRGEGWRGVAVRLADRLAERRRRAAFRPGGTAPWPSTTRPSALVVLPLPPAPRRGGAQTQVMDRLEVERAHHPLALLFPAGASWRLEWSAPGRAGTAQPLAGPPLEVIVEAARRSGTPLVHLECAGGALADLVPGLRRSGLVVVLALHDFGLFCRRPHLVERPALRFCGFSTDAERCAACLREDGADAGDTSLQRHRATGGAALAAAGLVVFPSEYLRREHARLFPGARREAVVAPATCDRPPVAAAPPGRRLAVVGAVKPEKGGLLVPEVVRAVGGELPGVRSVVIGEGDPGLLRALRRRAGVRVLGAYRAGGLPALLQASDVGVAVLPSVAPESYGLVVDECLRAGVPVVAFDHGAVGERLRALGLAELLVPLPDGARGLAARAVATLRSGAAPLVHDGHIAHLPRCAEVAEAWGSLYREVSG